MEEFLSLYPSSKLGHYNKEQTMVRRGKDMDFGKILVYIIALAAGYVTGYAGKFLMRVVLKKNKLEAIEFKFPLFEIINAVLYLILFLVKGFFIETVIYCIFATALLMLSIIDFKTYEIPFVINVFIFCLGIVRILFDFSNWYDYVIGFFAVSFVLYLIVLATKGRGMGGGDVKLMAAAGVVVGWKLVWAALIFGCILGSVIHVIRMKLSKETEPVLAFGPYLSLGLFIAVLYGNEFISWYLRLCGVRGY